VTVLLLLATAGLPTYRANQGSPLEDSDGKGCVRVPVYSRRVVREKILTWAESESPPILAMLVCSTDIGRACRGRIDGGRF
jgi:hypothetical protein